MDFILNSLTDNLLRRLYKFVLKRTIGKYLEDDLLIEQLEVISRDGVVKLKDIRFSADLLNEEFLSALPVKIVSFTVSELEVHLSYKTLLTDSCRFVVDNVSIVIAPNELYAKSQSSSKKPKERHTKEPTSLVPEPQPGNQRANPEHTSEEGQRSLSFIANWIEIVVARLQVQIGSINITFRIPPTDLASSAERHKSPENSRTSSNGSLSRSRFTAEPVTHDLVLTLKNIQYFNDDPQSYSTADANAVALSTKLTSAPDYSTNATAIQLGSKKVVRLECIEVRLIPCVPALGATSATTAAARAQTMQGAAGEAITLIRLGSHLVMNVKLDRSQHSGVLKGVEVDTTIPNFLISIDIRSAKSLCAIIGAYSTAVAAEAAPKSNTAAVSTQDKNALLSKSIMQNVLMSDPTLRTLFWLEEQENSKKKRAGKGGGGPEDVLKRGDGGTGDVTDIDFARIAQLMRQYRTTRNAIGGAPGIAATGKPNLASSALLSQSVIVDSDSDGDFPASVSGDSSDGGDAGGDDGDSSGDDSADFHDAVSKKPVMRVRMGESKRGGGGLQSAMSGLNKSSYGASSRAAESGLFHSTTSGLLGGSSFSTGSASGMEQSGANVYSSGYVGSVYSAAPVPLLLSARLHILNADLLFTDTRAAAQTSAGSVASVGVSTGAGATEGGDGEEFSSAASFSSSGSSADRDAAAILGREELCLHMEEAVMRVSTVFSPPSPPATAFPYRKPSSSNTRNGITFTVSVAEVQLFEQYGEINYRNLRDRHHLREEVLSTSAPPLPLPRQKQMLVSFHSLQDSRRIYSSPHLNVSVEYTPPAEKSPQTSPTDRNNCASISTTVNLEPVVVSAGIATIERWVAALSGFPLISVAEEASTTTVACTVNIAQIELFLHADSREENYAAISSRVSPQRSASSTQDAYNGYWDTVLDAVDLAQHPDAWNSLHNSSSSSPYYEHLFTTRGGFRFLLSDISIKLATAEKKDKDTHRSSLNDSANLSDSKRLGRSSSGESMLQAVEMTQVCLYVYISLPTVPTARFDTEVVQEERRRFYSTLLVKASADDKRVHKVVISRLDPILGAKLNRSTSEDVQDDDFVLLKDLHRQPSKSDTRGPQPAQGASTAAPAATPAGSGAHTGGADVGPSAPVVSAANLIYVSAYHIQVDIKQREYNVLMMVSDTIAPKPAAVSSSTASSSSSSQTGAAHPSSAASPKRTPGTAADQSLSPASTSSGTTTVENKSTGFGFVLSSKIATICLSDNEPHVFDFPELDELLTGERDKSQRSERKRAKKEAGKSKSFSICVSIIEPAFEVLISDKDIYLSVKADDLSIYEMELSQFRQLLQSGFDFNQTTGREARYGPNRHLVPFIRRASLHSHANSTANGLSLGVNKTDLFSTLLGNNQDYGQAFEVRLLLTSSGAGKTLPSGAPAAEVKSVHFFIDFYDIMLSYDPQSTWILSVANMLTPQTAAQILCHRQEERLRAAVERYQQLSTLQRDYLALSLDEFVHHVAVTESATCCAPNTSAPPKPEQQHHNQQQKKSSPQDASGEAGAGAGKSTITLALPFELTKVNVRVRDCIIDFCCDPCSSRTFLTIGLLTVTSTIASNSQRFSLKFKVGGLSLYISDVLPLPTVQTVRKGSEFTSGGGGVSSALTSSYMANSYLADSISGLRGGRFKKFPSLYDAARGTEPGNQLPGGGGDGDGSEVYDEDIGQFFSANSFVDLASVDHIDVLVTINNSELEALVIQINIGLCSINACVDSLELFAKTMGEWFREFQVACAKSEEVMQKKSTSKSLGDLSSSLYAFSAPSGNLLDDDNFDTIRFCDALPVHGPADQPQGQANIQAPSAGTSETVSLAALLGQKMPGPTVHRGAPTGLSKGIFVQSSSTTASDMNTLLMEDYYSGLSLPTVPEGCVGNAPNNKVGVFSPFPASPFPSSDYPPADMSASATPRTQYTDGDVNNTSNRWVAQYDYEDDSCSTGGGYNDYITSEHGGQRGIPLPPPQITSIQAGKHPTRSSAIMSPAVAPTSAGGATEEGEEDDDDAEQEGAGGFYTEGEGADADLEGLEEISEEEDDAEGFDDDAIVDQADDASDQDDSAASSVKSIDLDDTFDELGEECAASRTSSQDSDEEKPLSRSVFGLGNFTYFGLSGAASSAKPPATYEEFELKDFNPQPVGDVFDFGDANTLPFATEPTSVSPIVQFHNATNAAGSDAGDDSGAKDAWLQEELSASVGPGGLPRQTALTVSISSHRSNEDFAYNSDPEDEPHEHSEEQAPYEADFEVEEGAPFEADYGDNFGYDADSGYEEAEHTTSVLAQSDGGRNSDDMKNASVKDRDGDGWRNYDEDRPNFSLTDQSIQFDDSSPAKLLLTTVATAASSAQVASPMKPVSETSTPPPVQIADLSLAEQIALDDHDRAWMQNQQYDYIYEPYNPADKPAAANNSSGSGDGSGGRGGSAVKISTVEAVVLPITLQGAEALPATGQPRQSGVKPAATSASAAAGAGAQSQVPCGAPRKVGRVVQPIEAAQWYQNPDQLEIMPHYIPVVSRTEDLDDHRPAEEQTLQSKMLMKLKGTFKIRLFQGSDWHRASKTLPASADITTDTTALKASGEPSREEALSSSAAAATGKSVRFKKEDLLRDLTAPPVSGTSSGSRKQPGGNNGNGNGGSSSRSAISSRTGALKGTAHRSSRSSKPLFDDTASLGGKRDGPQSKEPGDSAASTTATSAEEPLLPRSQRDMLDATFKELFFCIRMYDNSSTGSVPPVYSLPTQRMVISAHDFLVSFGKVGARRKKVLGSWISLNRPRDTIEPVLRCSFLAYENPPITSMIVATDGASATSAAQIEMEHRLYVRILPLRCYLDEQVISFAKQLAVTAGSNNPPLSAQKSGGDGGDEATEGTPSMQAAAPKEELYFQSIMITATEIKIDYRASSVNVQALHSGDYLQLLNIFPLDGLEITLKHVKINGVKGVPAFLNRMLEQWIKDIYSNQLHRVISGTAPFRGLSNIGNDLQELMAIPLRDYRKTGGAMKQLRRSTRTLVRTVTRETLHATQQLTMFVANALSELAADGPVATPAIGTAAAPTPRGPASQGRIREHGQGKQAARLGNSSGNSAGAQRQPSGVVEGLQQAVHSVSREVSSAAETVIAIPIREYVNTGPGGYLKSVIRAFPIAVLRPVAGVLEGVSYTMLGLRNDIDPGARLDEEDVWNVDLGTAFPVSPVRGESSDLPAHPAAATGHVSVPASSSRQSSAYHHQQSRQSGEQSSSALGRRK